MEVAPQKVAELHPKPAARNAKRPRKSRPQVEDVIRYFLSKEGSSIEKPELGVEVASEAEALIQSFQSKNSVIYAVNAFKAEAEIEGGSPTLVKRALAK